MQPNLKATYSSQKHANSSCSSISKYNQPKRKLTKDLNGCIFKEGIEMGIKPMKRCSASLLEKCQSNCNKVSAHPLRMTILQQIYKDSMLQRARGNRRPPYTVGGDGNGWVQPQENSMEIPENIKYSCHPMKQA